MLSVKLNHASEHIVHHTVHDMYANLLVKTNKSKYVGTEKNKLTLLEVVSIFV